ncbi:MAG: beta-phosphoglucomutase family hydrolase [Bifidobacterium sp.]|jgi:alpha,alpha-trehalose phosphorylase
MRKLQAVLFDLDGVLVPTTILHMKAWKELFDSFLPADAEPYTDNDYFQYVDGKPRYDGVASMLQSRGISLAQGNPADGDDARTVCGLGNRKNAIFEHLLHERGVEPYDDTVDVLRHYIAQGTRLAVVSSSRNAREVLKRAGIIRYFDQVVDGEVRARHALPGKPAPDTFLYAAQLLDCDIDETAVFEDALSGVAAGRAGNFGLVVGVNRGVGQKALMRAGADVVVNDLVEIIDGNTSTMRRKLRDSDDPLAPDAYPVDEWSFTERRRPSDVSATLFSVSNGTIGIRGAGAGERLLGNGTFLSGFHENSWITYPEDAYGLARVGQTIQGVPDASDFHMLLDGRPIEDSASTSVQRIDFRRGVSTVTQDYVFGPGRTLTVTTGRMTCLFEPNLALITLNLSGKGLEGSSLEVDGRPNVQTRTAGTPSDDPRKGHAEGAGIERILRETAWPATRRSHAGEPALAEGLSTSDVVDVYRCRNSRLSMAVGLRQYVNGSRTNSTHWRFYFDGDESIDVIRYVAYHSYELEPRGVYEGLRSSTRRPQDPARLAAHCRRTLERYGGQDPSRVLRKQRAWLSRFWRRSDVEIDSSDGGRLQQALRWELFQLAQSTASVPNGISAKGLSGTGYSGHYFWDTEIYILPFLLFSDPTKARRILDYRYRMLPAARRRTATLDLDGALFPWRTINGEEASAYFPAGTAQYHIDADIAYAVEQYVAATGDTDFLDCEGIDILVETARMWASIGFVDTDQKYHIHRVTGPDEYSALVDDNFYTNVMARFNLCAAYETMRQMREGAPPVFADVCGRLNVTDREMAAWKSCADAMFIPYNEQFAIHEQDADFLNREPWDFVHLKARPLLLHYHSLEIYRKQVIKQPDVILALLLLGDEFSLAQKTADYDYYDRITTGDSTLSAAVQGIVGAEVGREDLAMSYFHESLFADLANAHDNTADGVHLASAGGVWLSLVEGFAGMRIKRGRVSFTPHLPRQWKSMSLRLTIRGNLVKVTVTAQGVTTEVMKSNPRSPFPGFAGSRGSSGSGKSGGPGGTPDAQGHSGPRNSEGPAGPPLTDDSGPSADRGGPPVRNP